MATVDYEIAEFSTPKLFEKWLAKNHDKVPGIWLRMYKKDSGVKSVKYSEALDVALCYGWIDGQSKRENELSYIQKFTPRRSKSMWSKINREHIARLTKEGRMHPAGLAQVSAAKADGRWDAAYDSSTSITEPADFLKVLKKNKAAYEFYKTLKGTNRYAILVRIQMAKRKKHGNAELRSSLKCALTGKKSTSIQLEAVMKLVRNYWLQFTLTALAAAYAYTLDARDGSIAWPLLLTGTIIAAAGFFGGSYWVKQAAVRHDHR